MDLTDSKKTGKKHKKHKKQSHAHEGPGAMRVSFRLPGIPETRPQSQWAHKELVTNTTPLELKVSIPWAVLRKSLHMSSRAGEGGGESSEHRHHKHKHKKHKKKKHHQVASDHIPAGPPVETSHHVGSGFEQAQPPPPLQSSKVMLPQVSSLSPKQFYEHHKHREKHHHRKQPPTLPQGHDSVPLTQPSHHVPPIPSLLHRDPQQIPPEHSAPHLTSHDATHRHRHKKKKKHKHSKIDHHVRPLVSQEVPPLVSQEVPPLVLQEVLPQLPQEVPLQMGSPYTQPISPLSDDDSLHTPLDDFPPSPKRSRTEDPPATQAKPHYALPLQQPTPTWKPQSTKPSEKTRDLDVVRLPEVDSLLPQRSLETDPRSVYTEMPHPQLSPVQPPTTTGPSILNPPPHQHRPQLHVKLSRASLKFFLRNLHYQIQRRDPEGIFADPVTDDIAPGYSSIIPQPMDLGTIGRKVQRNLYPSVNEFKDDFVLMCNNAMTYNAPETVYYTAAKNLLTAGLKIIAKETCLRPDIRYGKLSTPVNRSETVSPAPPPDFLLPPATNVQIDYTSPFICKINLDLLRSQVASNGSKCSSPVLPTDQNDIFPLDINGEISDQSHLTKVTVGVEDEGEGMVETPEEVLMQVHEAAEEMKENLDTNFPGGVTAAFLNRGPEGKTMLNILNPQSAEVDVCKPVDLTLLSERVRAGNNAATVLKTELPMFKATPVSYLMYGPFGSFAPVYDSTFATLTKMDSDLLLSTYGSELGVSYAHSLQQFVKGTGSFVSQMADAVLNGLTGGRHSDFMGKFRVFEEKERKVKESLRMEVQTPPREKGSPETKNGSAASNDGDQPSSVASGDSGRDQPSSVASGDSGRDQPSSVVSGDSGRDQPSSVASGDNSREQTSLGPEKEVVNMGGGSKTPSRGGDEVGGCKDMESPHKTPPSDATSNTQSQMSPCDINGQLQHTSELISELQHHQLERLSQPPTQMSEGHFILPASSQEEISTASKLTQELVALTSQVTPADVVSVPTLHRAMGITLQPVEQSTTSDRIQESLPARSGHLHSALPTT